MYRIQLIQEDRLAMFLKKPEKTRKGNINRTGRLATKAGSVVEDPTRNPREVPVKDRINMVKYIVKNCYAVLPRPIIQ